MLNNAVLVRVLTRRVEEGLLLVLASIGLAIALASSTRVAGQWPTNRPACWWSDPAFAVMPAQFLFGFVKSVAALLVVMALVSVTSATLGTVTGAQVGLELERWMLTSRARSLTRMSAAP